jgi:hypothetical protein
MEPVVELRVWQVPASRVPAAIARMGYQRRPLRRATGLAFAKLLGTGSGRTFTMRDADPRRWALLTVFDSGGAADDFNGGEIDRSWSVIADESLRLRLRPLSSRGRWAGRQPFGDPCPERWDGPVAALTRARIKPSQWRLFWSSVPPVATDLRARDGLRMSLGIGEAPLGLQGTFSVWESNSALTAFAQRGAAHRVAIEDTARHDWYAEELFARFAVTSAVGSFDGQAVVSE